jgi:hydroxymethylpyrimidine/phosphomethylpyrimidine kinase
MTPPVALSIAGSDSGGGAGIQADLRTWSSLGVHGATAVTAVTAQNTMVVRHVYPIPAPVVVAQIEAVLDDLFVAAVKTGMLPDPATIDAVADMAASGRLPFLVVDPVFVSSSGQSLSSPASLVALRDRLLPHAMVVTPNAAEAALLTGLAVDDLPGQRRAALTLGARTPTVVVTGGDLDGDPVDVICHHGDLHECRHRRIVTSNSHGTGCTFSAALAAFLMFGLVAEKAVSAAAEFVAAGLIGASDWRLGQGRGPLDHFGWSSPAESTSLPFSPASPRSS